MSPTKWPTNQSDFRKPYLLAEKYTLQRKVPVPSVVKDTSPLNSSSFATKSPRQDGCFFVFFFSLKHAQIQDFVEVSSLMPFGAIVLQAHYVSQ